MKLREQALTGVMLLLVEPFLFGFKSSHNPALLASWIEMENSHVCHSFSHKKRETRLLKRV
jgi:hypothetical protein